MNTQRNVQQVLELSRSSLISKEAPAAITKELLLKLSPHRTNESSWLKNLACDFGFHRWYRPEVKTVAPGIKIRFCLRCPAVKLF